MNDYRLLTQAETETLQRQGCEAEEWNNIRVSGDFNPKYIVNVQFSGQIWIGSFQKTFEMSGGFKRHSGLYNCAIHNCSIGKDVYINKIHNYIANYDIGDEVYIENTTQILVDGRTSFGNGVIVSVMNEIGGREIPIFNFLSAPLAYMLTFYRHKPTMITKVVEKINAYSESISAERGRIGKGTHIINCGRIKNVWIGDYAKIKGTSNLKNGSINSNLKAPVIVGSGVKCKDFIISSGVSITDSTLVSKSFIGQGCIMDKHYSVIESLFFANCQGMHGEATSVFAGPFTVTHHKSTLLIAGMFSFLNAGSGSNQSNHMYKLGPIHQGIVERGSKTTSDSYILWPAKIGAFTLVMGRHTTHPDTTHLPFSYLIENATESVLVPGVNLRSVGTIRDAQKWPKRDNRTDDHLLDPINYNLLSPYIIHKMYKGIDTLRELKKVSGETSSEYAYQNCSIRNTALNKGINLYQMGIYKFLGNSLISKIEKEKPATFEELQSGLVSGSERGLGAWVDLAGLIVPKNEIKRLIDDIEFSEIELSDILNRLWFLHREYYDLEWTWAQQKLEFYWRKPIQKVSKKEIVDFIRLWKESVVNLDNMLYEDAKKEFNLSSMIGFGMDGDEEEKYRDFENVRGNFAQNPFVMEVLNHIDQKTHLGEKTIALVESLP